MQRKHYLRTDMAPLVSIIIPTFNYGNYIGDTLSNVLNQSFQDWECIVVDDGSTDATSEVVHRFSEKDRRIRYHWQRNGGLSNARNTGIRLAEGEFIQLLDADDLLSPKKLDEQTKAMENRPELGITYSDARYFRHGQENETYRKFEYINKDRFCLNNKPWIPETDWTSPCELIEYLYLQNIAPVNALLIQRWVFDKVGGFDESFTSLEDWHFIAKAALNGIRFSFVGSPEAYAKIRVHTDSMSFNRPRMEWNHIRLLLDMERGLSKSGLSCHPPTGLIDQRVRKLITRKGLGNIQHIRLLANTMGWARTLKLYIKELNANRKKH